MFALLGSPGVVAAAGADDVVDGRRGGEEVRRLALALVAPLGTEHHDRRHVTASSPETKSSGAISDGASCDETLPDFGCQGGVIDVDFGPNWEFNFGIGVGATAGTDHILVKAIVGYRFKAK